LQIQNFVSDGEKWLTNQIEFHDWPPNNSGFLDPDDEPQPPAL
jgi:hypothetical protein